MWLMPATSEGTGGSGPPAAATCALPHAGLSLGARGLPRGPPRPSSRRALFRPGLRLLCGPRDPSATKPAWRRWCCHPAAAAAAAAAAGTDGLASWTGAAGARVVTHAAAGVRVPAESWHRVRVRRWAARSWSSPWSRCGRPRREGKSDPAARQAGWGVSPGHKDLSLMLSEQAESLLTEGQGH